MRRGLKRVIFGWMLVCLAASARETSAVPGNEAFKLAKLGTIDAAVATAIAEKKLPGGVIWLQQGDTIYHKAYGRRALTPSEETMTEDTIFDAASLTKVIATTPAIMLLADRALLKIDDPVVGYLPEFGPGGKGAITLRHLLTHTSGLAPGLPREEWSGYDEGIRRACLEIPLTTPGAKFVYSDINFIVLGEIIQRVSGKRLADFVQKEIYQPLGMMDTGYLPAPDKGPRIAPTQIDATGRLLRGIVHDPTAQKMGGVAGHAGVFTTAADLARFARMMLNEGDGDGRRLFPAPTVQRMTNIQTSGTVVRRGFGWDIDSAYAGPRGAIFPLGSYGHTGWTGTSLWINPASQTFILFLSNRVHPDGKGEVTGLRRTLGTLAAEATGLSLPPSSPAAVAIGIAAPPVLNGIDVLVRENFARLRGLKVGLITNHTGRDRQRASTIDLLYRAPEVRLLALFSPEHGIRGIADTHVGDGLDEKTGLPIYSLYSETVPRWPGQSEADFDREVMQARQPKPEQMRDLDALVFDLQDIGARFYTYAATLGGALDAAGRARKKIFVLDRVNPISGGHLEGPVQTRHFSFIGYHSLPVRHGMTMGELAQMFNAERLFNADLNVVRCENWRRDDWFDETGLPWANPSPSMRSLNAATLYPGVCLLESTSVSMGRGTDKPFEQAGAPYIDDVRFAEEMNRFRLPGVQFVPVRFTPRVEFFPGPPAALKYRDEECGGVQMIVTDRGRCHPVDIGIVMAQVLLRLYPQQFDIDRMTRLLGDEATLQGIKGGKTLAEIKHGWQAALQRFEARRKTFLLYPLSK